MLLSLRIGYTLIEIVVAFFLFAVGGLALVATSAVISLELTANATREQAGRIAASRLEILGAECRSARAGSETMGRIESEWSVGFPDSSHVSLVESVTFPTRRGSRTDLYRVTLPCPR
jgi:type II secretory pathway component PulJ